MRIKIETTVNADLHSVFNGFNKSLFLKLTPPGMPVELERFDGVYEGAEVHLNMRMPLRKQKWVSVITEHRVQLNEIYFIDEGTVLPAPFHSWHHQHRMIKDGSKTRIIDDISYQCRPSFMNALFFPLLYLQFLYRKPVYRHVFSEMPAANDVGPEQV